MKSIFPGDAREGREHRGRRFRQIRRTLFENAFRLLARIHDFSKAQQAAAGRCEKIADIPYLPDGNPDHLLDIYRLKYAAHPLPVILYIHGGGFVMCDKDTHRGIGLIYADHGHVVFNVNYRLAPRHPYPAALVDAGRAYAWVVENAARYGGDPGRIIIAGESAGGAKCSWKSPGWASRTRRPESGVCSCGPRGLRSPWAGEPAGHRDGGRPLNPEPDFPGFH